VTVSSRSEIRGTSQCPTPRTEGHQSVPQRGTNSVPHFGQKGAPASGERGTTQCPLGNKRNQEEMEPLTGRTTRVPNPTHDRAHEALHTAGVGRWWGAGSTATSSLLNATDLMPTARPERQR